MAHNQPVPSPRPADAVSDKQTPNTLNAEGVIFPSAARTNATYTSDAIHNANAKGVRLYIDITAVGGGPGTVTAEIQTQDPVSKNWKRLTGCVTTALNSVSTGTLTVYPSTTVSANIDLSNQLGPIWRVVAVVGVNSVTFSIGADYLI